MKWSEAAVGMLIMVTTAITAADDAGGESGEGGVMTKDTVEVERERASGGNDDDVVVVKETKDTVYVVSRRRMKQMASGFRRKTREMRLKGYGGSGGPFFGIAGIDMGPVRELVENDRQLREYRFDIGRYEPFGVNGGMGYGGVGHGLRLGGLGMSGSRSFRGKNGGDSTVVLETEVSYGGFLVEKAFVKERLNAIAGGVMGSGTFEAVRRAYGESTIFHAGEDEPAKSTAEARFFCAQVHGALTYTVATFFHVGAAVSVPTFVSTNGFDYRSSDFVSVNPSLTVRVMFGNLG